MRPRVILLAALASLPAAPNAARAQDGGRPCSIVFTGVMRGGVYTSRTTMYRTASGARHTFVGGGVDATCEGQGNRLLADSAEHYEDRGELILINRVRYSEPRVNMQSDRMFYYTNEEKLVANGNVRGRTNTGTRFTGPEFTYFRAKEGVRPQPMWLAPGRPFVRMAPQDTAAARRAPKPGEAAVSDSVDLTADLVTSLNDSLIWANGKVIIERHDLRATADSATLDQPQGYARLLRDPKIVGTGERPFTMTGVEIDMWTKDERIDRVRSAGKANVISDSLTLDGDTIDLRFADQLMQRVFTWGGRAKAVTPQQEMEADSLDIRMPAQRLHELHALGRAIAYTVVDSVKIVSTERDWIAGDTIVALFDTARAEGDTTSGSRMKEVTANGRARAYYQLAPNGGERGPPNISYNSGRQIIVSFTDGEVEKVDVRDRATGLFLEPIAAPPPDTSRSTAPKPAPKRP